MPSTVTRAVAAASLLLMCGGAFAAEAVRRIGIHVQPYYESAPTPAGRPRVAVGRQFDALLASNRREDVLAARDHILAAPKAVTPMTMMVLAIRLYDVGERDEAVLWFYVAKDRYLVLADVVDIRQGGLVQVEEAIGAFSRLAGPAINGYAFCDLAKQQALHARAVAWVEANPYAVMFMPALRAKPGDREANHRRGIANAKERAAKERAYFGDARKRDAFYTARKRTEVDARYCWR